MKKAIVDVPTCDQGFFKKLMEQNLWIWEYANEGEEFPDYDEDDFEEPLPHPVWHDKYVCFGDDYWQLEYCACCKDKWQCKYEYFDERK